MVRIKFWKWIQKPDDWLDDEPGLVPDPNSLKPDDWDEEEDGEWEAPQIGKSLWLPSSHEFLQLLLPGARKHVVLCGQNEFEC